MSEGLVLDAENETVDEAGKAAAGGASETSGPGEFEQEHTKEEANKEDLQQWEDDDFEEEGSSEDDDPLVHAMFRQL
jgi:hypothetical protein